MSIFFAMGVAVIEIVVITVTIMQIFNQDEHFDVTAVSTRVVIHGKREEIRKYSINPRREVEVKSCLKGFS